MCVCVFVCMCTKFFAGAIISEKSLYKKLGYLRPLLSSPPFLHFGGIQSVTHGWRRTRRTWRRFTSYGRVGKGRAGKGNGGATSEQLRRNGREPESGVGRE